MMLVLAILFTTAGVLGIRWSLKVFRAEREARTRNITYD